MVIQLLFLLMLLGKDLKAVVLKRCQSTKSDADGGNVCNISFWIKPIGGGHR